LSWFLQLTGGPLVEEGIITKYICYNSVYIELV